MNAKRGLGEVREEAALPAVKASEVRLKRIVVATDFSECSRKAVQYAVSLGKQYQAQVVLVHVLEPAPPQVPVFDGALADTSLQEDMARQLEEWRAQASAEVVAKTEFCEGAHPHRYIVAVAEEVDADLIIVGNHGRKALGRAFMGSTAEKVVRNAHCPVLVVRLHEHDFVGG